MNKRSLADSNSVPTLYRYVNLPLNHSCILYAYFCNCIVPVWLIFSFQSSESAFFRLGELGVTLNFDKYPWGLEPWGGAFTGKGGWGIFRIFPCKENEEKEKRERNKRERKTEKESRKRNWGRSRRGCQIFPNIN